MNNDVIMSNKRLRKDKTGSGGVSQGIYEGEFNVEKILDKRVRKGRIEYYLKWKGFPHEDNTWEPIKNLRCREIIDEFERLRKEESERVQNEKKRKLERMMDQKRSFGFDKGLKAEKVLGVTQNKDILYLLIKWKGINGCELVPNYVANVKCPQKVIQFYEQNIKFK